MILGGFALARLGAPGSSPSPSPAGSSEPPTVSATPTDPTASPVASATADAQGNWPTIDGISCDLLEHTEFHIHAHLAIRVNGVSQNVPANIGIHETCLYWVHTHTDSGIVHVEAPGDTQATLGTFFDIWGQPLTDRQVATWIADSGESVFAFVNGERYTSDPLTIRLKDLELIELQIGPSPLEPLPFEYPPGFQ